MQGAMLAHWTYLTGIGSVVALHYVPFLKQARGALPTELQILPPLLAVVAVADYGLSLWMERVMRAKGTERHSAMHLVTVAFGVSIAIYGMVAWLLGASTGWLWGFVFFAVVHWFHAAVRWQSEG